MIHPIFPHEQDPINLRRFLIFPPISILRFKQFKNDLENQIVRIHYTVIGPQPKMVVKFLIGALFEICLAFCSIDTDL